MSSQVFTSVESVAKLRATTLPTDKILYLEGFHSPGDGGEEMFQFHTSRYDIGQRRHGHPGCRRPPLVSRDQRSTL